MEPIWAIGTGKVATTEQAQEVCAASVHVSQKYMMKLQQKQSAFSMVDLYLQPAHQNYLHSQISTGGLVGGASLKPDFGKIVNYK